MQPRYIVEALDEPNGEGNGWEQVDDDAKATLYGVADSLEFDGWLAAFDTRDKAQAEADRLNASPAVA